MIVPRISAQFWENLPEELGELTDRSRNSSQYADQLSVEFDLYVLSKPWGKIFQFMCNASTQCGKLLFVEK